MYILIKLFLPENLAQTKAVLSSISYDDSGITIESANLGSKGVQIMESAVVAVSRNTTHAVHLIEIPGGKNQQTATSTCLEAAKLGLPVVANRFFL